MSVRVMSKADAKTIARAKRNAERREQLTKGNGFFRFDELPESWRMTSLKSCCVCRRGQANGLEGLWEFGPTWICNDCAKDVVNAEA